MPADTTTTESNIAGKIIRCGKKRPEIRRLGIGCFNMVALLLGEFLLQYFQALASLKFFFVAAIAVATRGVNSAWDSRGCLDARRNRYRYLATILARCPARTHDRRGECRPSGSLCGTASAHGKFVDRKSVVEGKSVDLGGRRIIK